MQRSPLSTIVVLAVQPKKVPAIASQFGGAAFPVVIRRGRPLFPLRQLPLDKEHLRQPAFAQRLAKDAESEKWNEHQQHDEIASERFLQPRSSERGERGSNRLAMEQADNGFLNDGHDYQ